MRKIKQEGMEHMYHQCWAGRRRYNVIWKIRFVIAMKKQKKEERNYALLHCFGFSPIHERGQRLRQSTYGGKDQIPTLLNKWRRLSSQIL